MGEVRSEDASLLRDQAHAAVRAGEGGPAARHLADADQPILAVDPVK